jgi:hypothetical protein
VKSPLDKVPSKVRATVMRPIADHTSGRYDQSYCGFVAMSASSKLIMEGTERNYRGAR